MRTSCRNTKSPEKNMTMYITEEADYEDMMRRIGCVRRSAGLSQMEFARRLNVPLWNVELAEHGAFMCCGEIRRMNIWELLSEREISELLEAVGREFRVPLDWLKYGRGSCGMKDVSRAADESTFYFPMTLSVRSLEMDMQRLRTLNSIDPDTGLRMAEKDIVDAILGRFKAYCRCMQQCRNFSAIHRARNTILRLCKI